MEDMEYWTSVGTPPGRGGPGSEDEANAAALEHQEETGHEANVSAGGVDTYPPGDKP
jgi:hypothetical protein